MEFGPFPVAIGRAVAPTVRGWINRGGYNISVVGEAEIAKSLRVARLFGLAALQSATEGSAQVDLQIAGSWAGRSNGTASGFTGPQVTGTAKLTERSRRNSRRGWTGRDCVGGHAALARRGPRREVEREGRGHIVDWLSGNAARLRNPRQRVRYTSC